MATSSRGRRTQAALRATDANHPVDRSDPNHDVMEDFSEGNELTIPSTQNQAARHELLQHPELKENITALSLGDFLEAPIQLQTIQLNKIQEQAAQINHDPATGDFKALLTGKVALQDLIRATSHHETLLSLLQQNKVPQSLRANRRVNVFKPSSYTTIVLRSLTQQFERKLTQVLINHHAETINTAKLEFRKAYEKAETSPNLLILTCNWIATVHQTLKALTERRKYNRQEHNKSRNAENNRGAAPPSNTGENNA